MRLAEQADLHEIVTEKVLVPTDKGAMCAGLLRPGATWPSPRRCGERRTRRSTPASERRLVQTDDFNETGRVYLELADATPAWAATP